MLTKKHFKALAAILANARPTRDPNGEEDTTWTEIREGIADFCAGLNPNFDRDRFLEACNKEE
jgi:hypothetical protein